jgi:CHAT domain-containing protein
MRLVLLLSLLAVTAFPARADIMPKREVLMSSSRFVELEKLSEEEIRADPQADSYKLMPLCMAYGKLKRYDKLFPCLEKLKARVDKGDIAFHNVPEYQKMSPFLMADPGSGFPGGLAEFEGNVTPFLHMMYAEAYNELGDHANAIAHAGKARDQVPKNWASTRWYQIQTMGLLALSHAFAGDKGQAEQVAEQVAALPLTDDEETIVGRERAHTLSRVYAALGRFDKVKAVLTEQRDTGFMYSLAKSLASSMAGMEGDDHIFAYFEVPRAFLLHKAQLETGDIAAAKAGFDTLLQDPRVRGNGEIHWLLLLDRGRIALRENDPDLAIKLWQEAVDIIEQQRSTIHTEANKIGFVGDKQAVYRHLIVALFARNDLAAAFDYLERSKSRALVDLLAAKQDFSVAGAKGEQLRALLAQTESVERSQLVQTSTGQRTGTRSLAVAPLRQIRDQAPELASLVSVTSSPLDELRGKLADDEMLIEYYYDDRNLYAFALTRDSLRALRTDAAGLENDIRAWRRALEDSRSADHLALSQKLHAKLIAPFSTLLDKPRLVIVAHSLLHYVPLAALHDGSRYLIDQYALRLLPSASVLKYLKTATPGRPTGVLAFGNPDLGDPRLDLQHAQEEAQAVTRMVPQSKALLRKDANESAFRLYAPGFRFLHFATHGEFRAEAPLESALLLARDEKSDGALTVGKLYSIQLDADLVTLSACETGLGKIASGDDVVGLTRGFLYAGASTIVASLWKVDDQATADLMRTFYRDMSKGDKQEALRRAQQAARDKYPHPYYWAAFQLIGNPAGEGYASLPESVNKPAPAEKPQKPAAKGKKK